MLEMQTKYETEKKETLLQRRQMELYMTLGGLLLLLLIALLLWSGYINKRKHNRVLEQRNEEKEFLIKEIHHRVKNNLQVLSSLLSLQSDYVRDPAALDAVMEGRNRVQSMGLIHQKLYTGENLASVDMQDYVRDLTDQLLSSFGLEDRVDINLAIQIGALDVDSAIPLGLIINELVTNSLKYAFPGNLTAGKMEIRLWINEEKELCLLVSDDGVGLKNAADTADSTAFGTDLVQILSRKLKGRIQTHTDPGFATFIRFARYRLQRVPGLRTEPAP